MYTGIVEGTGTEAAQAVAAQQPGRGLADARRLRLASADRLGGDLRIVAFPCAKEEG